MATAVRLKVAKRTKKIIVWSRRPSTLRAVDWMTAMERGE